MTATLQDIAKATETILTKALATKNHASLALSGGSTPKAYMPQIANLPLDWQQITLTLADERAVAPTHADSNAYLNKSLIKNTPMESARFIPLSQKAQDYNEIDLNSLEQKFSTIPQPLDLILLGMGDDGHIASLFPHHETLSSTAPLFVKCPPPTPPHPQHARISLSPKAILAAHHVFLIFSGKSKQAIWQKAQKSTTPIEIPVSMLQQHKQLQVFDLTPS